MVAKFKGISVAMLVSIISIIGLSGCSSTTYIKANATPPKQAVIELPSHLYMDVGILPLKPNIPTSEKELEKQLIIPDVRRAESQYIAYHLKATMEQSGNWGALRVTPGHSETVDLTISGEILASDGERLIIKVAVTDATGKRWFTKEYQDHASKFSYAQENWDDPFQDLYNQISNDALAYREQLSNAEIANIRHVAALRYARSLVPDNFNHHLEDKGGEIKLLSLPAKSDRMLVRVDNVKEREYLFIDTLDDFYNKFYRDMRPAYYEWRFATYSEAIKLRQLQQKSRNQLLAGAALTVGGLYAGSESATNAAQVGSIAAVYQGINVVKAGLTTKKDVEIHAQSLKELSQSLGSEISPYVFEIEGKTIELRGTANVQYSEWQRILKDIYATETGSPLPSS